MSARRTTTRNVHVSNLLLEKRHVFILAFITGPLCLKLGQPFDVIAAAQGIDRLGDAGFIGNDLLRSERELGALFGGDVACRSDRFRGRLP